MLVLTSCVTAPAPTPSVDVEGLVRQAQPSCAPGFRLAVQSAPVAGRTFVLRRDSVEGPEVARFTTSDEGAFRARLDAGALCLVDLAGPERCAARLGYAPASEPVPVFVLSPAPCH